PQYRILPPNTRLLGAAKRYRSRSCPVLVHPGSSHLQARGDGCCALGIVAPNGAREAVARIIGAPDHVFDIAELQHRYDRPELLLAHESTVLFDIGDDGRREE